VFRSGFRPIGGKFSAWGNRKMAGFRFGDVHRCMGLAEFDGHPSESSLYSTLAFLDASNRARHGGSNRYGPQIGLGGRGIWIIHVMGYGQATVPCVRQHAFPALRHGRNLSSFRPVLDAKFHLAAGARGRCISRLWPCVMAHRLCDAVSGQ